MPYRFESHSASLNEGNRRRSRYTPPHTTSYLGDPECARLDEAGVAARGAVAERQLAAPQPQCCRLARRCLRPSARGLFAVSLGWSEYRTFLLTARTTHAPPTSPRRIWRTGPCVRIRRRCVGVSRPRDKTHRRRDHSIVRQQRDGRVSFPQIQAAETDQLAPPSQHLCR